MHIYIGFGKANLRTTMASYASFIVSPEFLREGTMNKGKRIGGWSAHNVGVTEHNGALYNVTMDVPENSILLVQASERRMGASVRDGAVFIELQPHGHLVSVDARVPQGNDNVYGSSHTLFRGNGYILGEEELLERGVEPTPSFVSRFMQGDEIDECFNVMTLMEGLRERPKAEEVVSPEGIVRRVLPQAPRRRLRVR